MVKVMSIMPTYDTDGELLSCSVNVEITLASGELGNASFTLGANEIDFEAIGESIKVKIQNGLA